MITTFLVFALSLAPTYPHTLSLLIFRHLAPTASRGRLVHSEAGLSVPRQAYPMPSLRRFYPEPELSVVVIRGANKELPPLVGKKTGGVFGILGLVMNFKFY